MTWILWTALWGCGDPPPVITSVDPTEVYAGEEIKVLGERFDLEAQLSLRMDSEVVPLEGVSVDGVVLARATVPQGLASGSYLVVMPIDGGEITHPLTVKERVVNKPCGGLFTAAVAYSKAAREVTIQRSWKDGREEIVRVDADDVEGIEYELVTTEDGGLCSVIYLQQGPARVIFDDDREVDLKERAYLLGRSMNKPVSVTREDADGLPDKTDPEAPN